MSRRPRVYLAKLWRTSRQWILSPEDIGRLRLTMAIVFGFCILRGGSRLAMKSESWLNNMNSVAMGSNLDKIINK